MMKKGWKKRLQIFRRPNVPCVYGDGCLGQLDEDFMVGLIVVGHHSN